MNSFTLFFTFIVYFLFASAFSSPLSGSELSDNTILGTPIIQRQERDLRLSVTDQQAIVDKHNALRRQIAKGQESRGNPGPQPSASNMRQLRWDVDLARAAQTLTDRCVFAHDTKIPAGPWNGYGQNLAAGAFGSWSNAIQAWYDEVKDYSKNAVGNYQGGSGHYTQAVWANSYAIGCGFTVCPSGWSPIYACNYGPPGNYLGQSIYKTGAAASACPSGTYPQDGLCA